MLKKSMALISNLKVKLSVSKVVYCDIGKTGTSSWHAVFENMMKRERSKRTRLYKKHPYKPYKITEYERFR